MPCQVDEVILLPPAPRLLPFTPKLLKTTGANGVGPGIDARAGGRGVLVRQWRCAGQERPAHGAAVQRQHARRPTFAGLRWPGLVALACLWVLRSRIVSTTPEPLLAIVICSGSPGEIAKPAGLNFRMPAPGWLIRNSAAYCAEPDRCSSCRSLRSRRGAGWCRGRRGCRIAVPLPVALRTDPLRCACS